MALEYSTTTQKVWEAIKGAGPLGMTDEEIAAATQLEGNTVRPRRLELYLRGLIEEAPFTRTTRRGRRACVWWWGSNDCH